MTCKATKPNGEQCTAPSRNASDYCFFHDPSSSASRRDAQRKGGRKGARPQPLPTPTRDFLLDSPEGISDLIQYAANCILRGELNTKSATALGYLADSALRAYRVGKLSARIERLEMLQSAEENCQQQGEAEPFFSKFEEELEPKPNEGDGGAQ